MWEKFKIQFLRCFWKNVNASDCRSFNLLWFFFTCIFFSVAMRPRCWKGAAWPLIALGDGWGWVVVVGWGSEEGGGGRTVCMSSEQGFLHGNTWVSVFDSWNVFWYNPPLNPLQVGVEVGCGWGSLFRIFFFFFIYLTVIVWQIKDQSSNLVDDRDCGVFFFFFFLIHLDVHFSLGVDKIKRQPLWTSQNPTQHAAERGSRQHQSDVVSALDATREGAELGDMRRGGRRGALEKENK